MILIFKIDFQNDNDDSIYSGTSHSPYLAACQKLLEAILAKIARYRGCGSKICLEQDVDHRQSIGAQLKLFCVSIKRASVNFNSTEKQGHFYSGITQGHYY